MRKAVLAIALVAAVGVAQPASALTYCQGTVSHSWVDSAGNVFIYGSWRNDHTQICNVKAEWKGITPDVCATWIAKADAAVTLARGVIVYYPTESTCATVPTYSSAPAPGYFMLL